MLKKRIIILLFIALIWQIPTKSQTRTLSLSEALNLADENNLNTKSAEARLKAAKASYKMANSVFLPVLSVSHTAISTNDPLASFGFKLKQEIVQQADFNPVSLNAPDNIENYSTKLEIQQPIFNLDGIYARKAAKNQLDAMSCQAKRVKENIRFEVKKAYYMLELAESSVKVLEQSVKVAEDALKLTKDNERQGFAKYADVLEATVRVDDRKNQLLEAKNQLKSANEFLAHLLGLELTETIETTDSLIQPSAQIYVDNHVVNIKNRSDIKAYQKQIEAGENMLLSQKMKFIPRLNAFGSYEWNDHRLLGTAANNYMVGASLSWNILSGNKNAGAVQKANAQLNEARLNYQDYLSQSQIQINSAKRNVELKYNQITSSKLAKEQAREALRIRTDRYKQGLEKTTDLLMAETLASQKKLEYIHSIYNYRQSVFEMELLLEQDINE